MESNIDLPQLAIWLLRLGNNPSIQREFLLDPLLFANWYTMVGSALSWPDEVRRIQEQEQNRRLSFEKATSLLEKVNFSLTEAMGLGHARKLLEGYAVHGWGQLHMAAFKETLSGGMAVGERLENLLGYQGENDRVQGFAEMLKLHPLEKDVLVFTIAVSIAKDFRLLMDGLLKRHRGNALRFWSEMLGHSPEALSKALSQNSTLRVSGLLSAPSRDSLLPRISEFWLSVLFDSDADMLTKLVAPVTVRNTAGLPARLTREDQELGSRILAVAKEDGVNLLLYGAEGLDKNKALLSLVNEAGKQAYSLAPLGDNWAEAPTVAFVAQRALAAQEHQAVLVIDKVWDVLKQKPSEFFRTLFGLPKDDEGIKPLDRLLLETNPVSTVWVTADAESLPEEVTARFVFHAPLQKASKADRKEHLEALAAELGLSAALTEELGALPDVSALQLSTAVRAALLSGATSNAEREAYVLQAINRSRKALHREDTNKEKECVTSYSLEYLNTEGKFGPEQILRALAHRPKGSLCFYGPPGTGKTQFAEYLASRLGKPLLIKRASDLLSKWVGENEQNIAKMFADAEARDAILFLDEGDSFLQDRQKASHQWEVTRINELLQHMERFEGIFIMATNLFHGLDIAALRRFTFKVKFRELSLEQRWKMFSQEAGLEVASLTPKEVDEWETRLLSLYGVTAGDFATVKRQCLLMGETLTPEEWLEQLIIECSLKTKG